MAKLWCEHVPELPLPFRFTDFYDVAKKQIIHQSEDLSSSNRLSVFFDTISMLYTQGQIIAGREFEIITENAISVQLSKAESREISWQGKSKRVLYLIVNDVIQIYQKLHNSESLKLSALRTYLRDHVSYLGQIQSRRFTYEFEAWEADQFNNSQPKRVIKKASRSTSCIALDYEKLAAIGIDLDKLRIPQIPDILPSIHTATLETQEPLTLSKKTDDELPF
jgi:hypothetical protein